MIPQLVRLAEQRGLTEDPYWMWVKHDYRIDVETREVIQAPFQAVFRYRSSDAVSKPGFLTETVQNLLERENNRQAEIDLIRRYLLTLPDHPLLLGALQLLESRYQWKMPKKDQPLEEEGGDAKVNTPWVAFAYRGKTAADYEEIRALIKEDMAPALCETEASCFCCGKTCHPVRVHDGISIFKQPPTLVNWNLACLERNGTKQGANLPTCARCVRLYTKMLTILIEEGFYIGKNPVAELDGSFYLLGREKGSMWVEAVAPAVPRKRTAWATLAASGLGDFMMSRLRTVHGTLWDQDKKKQRDAMKELYKMGLDGKDIPTNWRDAAWQAGYQFGVFEHILVLAQIGAGPSLETVLASPRRALGEMGIRVHAAVNEMQTRWSARRKAMESSESKKANPKKKKDKEVNVHPRALHVWYTNALTCVLQDVQMPEHFSPQDTFSFHQGYIHALSRREARAGYGDLLEYRSSGSVTPHADRLMEALDRMGLERLPRDKEGWKPYSTGFIPELWITSVRGPKPQRRIDIAFPMLRFGIEVDGRYANDGSPRRIHQDEERSDYLAEKGWRIYRVQNSRVRDPKAADRIARIVKAELAMRADYLKAVGGVEKNDEMCASLWGEAFGPVGTDSAVGG